MDTVSIDKARKKLGDYVDQARYEAKATIITRHGKPAATIAPILAEGDLAEIADAGDLARRYGLNSEVGGLLGELLDIIGRLTGDMHDETKLPSHG